MLDHLLYAYRLKARFERAEWSDDGAAGDVTSTWNPVGPDHDGPPDRLRLW